MKNPWLLIAAVSGFFCVAFGAFATHGLAQTLEPKALGWIDTGVKYQMFHTLAILAVGVWQQIGNSRRARVAAVFWTLGILLFSGSLYSLALGIGRFTPFITPLGGIFFLLGWLCLAYESLQRKSV